MILLGDVALGFIRQDTLLVWGACNFPALNFKACMQLPKAACLEALPHLVRLLGAEANVTHSYAAIAIDRMLMQKVRSNKSGFAALVTCDLACTFKASADTGHRSTRKLCACAAR